MQKVGGFKSCVARWILFGIAGLLFSVGLSLIHSGKTSAIESGDVVIEIRPVSQSITLVPGQVYQGEIDVKNIGRLPFSFHMLSKPYSVSGDNYDPDYTTETDFTRLRNWITFSQNEFEIQPDETAKVGFTITVPEDVPSGSQYAALIAELKDYSDEHATFKQINQLASLLYARIDGGNIHESGEVIEQKLPRIVLGGDFSATETVKNTGNVDFTVTHVLSVTDFFTGKEVFGAESRDNEGNLVGKVRQMIFPGTKRSNTIVWENAPKLGVFRVTQTVEFLGETKTYEQLIFVVPFWLLALVGTFFGLMILWVIIRIFRRGKRRPQVF